MASPYTMNQYVSVLIQIAWLFTAVTSQSTICVWNAHDDFDRFNGEYVLSSTVQNGYQVWESKVSNSQCTISAKAKIYVLSDSGTAYWLMEEGELRHSYAGWGGDAHATCRATSLPSNPSGCGNNWYSYSGSGSWGSSALDITVTEGECPQLDCRRIEVVNAPSTGCEAIFTLGSAPTLMWYTLLANNAKRYLYFNQYQFKWYCSDSLSLTECTDSTIEHQRFSTVNDGWFQVSMGQNFQAAIKSSAGTTTATFYCLDTKSPTFSPTRAPTTSPTKAPTKAPTFSPTTHPTPSPTPSPTRAPTLAPTRAPTRPPTVAPTAPPTKKPTNAPTIPTIDPTLAPTNTPTISTIDPTTAPTLAPSTAPTMAPTTSWTHCAHHIECEYIARVTLNIAYDSADEFAGYLSTLKGKASIADAAKTVARNTLSEYVSYANILASTSFSQTTASFTLIAMVATDKKSKMHTLLVEVASENVAKEIQPLLGNKMNEEEAQYEFSVSYVYGAIVLIQPDKWPDCEGGSAASGGSDATLAVGLTATGIVLLVVTINILVCAYCVHKAREENDGDNEWIPHHFRKSTVEKQVAQNPKPRLNIPRVHMPRVNMPRVNMASIVPQRFRRTTDHVASEPSSDSDRKDDRYSGSPEEGWNQRRVPPNPPPRQQVQPMQRYNIDNNNFNSDRFGFDIDI